MVVENVAQFEINTYDRENGTLYRLFDVLRQSKQELVLSDAVTMGIFPIAKKDGPKHYVTGHDTHEVLSGLESGAIKIPDRSKGEFPKTKKQLSCTINGVSIEYGLVEKPRTPDETAGLIALYQDKHDPRIKDLVKESNIWLVLGFAKKWRSPNGDSDIEGSICEGILGLDHAIEKFDPYRGFAFSTYAARWIQNGFQRHSDNSRLIHIPEYMKQICLSNYKKYGAEWYKNPEAMEKVCKEHVRISPQDIIQTALAFANQCSVTGEKTEIDSNRAKKYEDPADEIIENMVQPEILASALSVLTSRSKMIIEQYFGLGGTDPKTLNEIGKSINLSRERVRQIIEDSINLMRSNYQ